MIDAFDTVVSDVVYGNMVTSMRCRDHQYDCAWPWEMRYMQLCAAMGNVSRVAMHDRWKRTWMTMHAMVNPSPVAEPGHGESIAGG